jgi:hypothetical protein
MIRCFYRKAETVIILYSVKNKILEETVCTAKYKIVDIDALYVNWIYLC